MNWNLIYYLLEEFEIVSWKNQNFAQANYICLWDGNESSNLPDQENTVYVFNPQSPGSPIIDGITECSEKPSPEQPLPELSILKKSLIIIINSTENGCPKNSNTDNESQASIRVNNYNNPDLSPNKVPHASICADNYMILKGGSETQVINKLLRAQSLLNTLTQGLSEITDAQDVIDFASKLLGVPFFYFDSSYRVLAITKNAGFSGDPEWKHMTEKGFLSPESVRLMRESGDLDMLADKKDPWPYRSSFFPFPSIVCNIWNDREFYSRLNMLCTDEPANEMKIQECRIICSCLLRIARSSGAALVYNAPFKNMVLDLLRGMRLSEELISDRLSILPKIKDCPGQVCCIEPKVRDDPRLLSYYTSHLERIFENDSAFPLEFDDHLIIILHAKDEDGFFALHEKLSQFLLGQGLKCGVSNLFYKFSTLKDHYLQAMKILTIGKLDQGINYFHDEYFDYILSFITRDQAMAMISWQIIRLLQLQKDYQFPLAQTLKVYLECGCNLQMSADKLFIHKNTALYRINHIKEILHADLDNYNIRMQLLFSFRILDVYPVKL